MKRRVRVMQWLLLLVAMLTLSACSNSMATIEDSGQSNTNGQDALAVQEQIKDFTLTNVDKQQVSLDKDTHAKAKLVYFFYSSCGDVCPVTQGRMEKIAGVLKAQNVANGDYKFLSISFDPARDTPDKLKVYSQLFDATPDRWQFLTGTKEQVKGIMDQFHVEATETSTHDFLHDDRIFLLDGKNQVRASYVMSTDVKDSDIISDMKQLIASK